MRLLSLFAVAMAGLIAVPALASEAGVIGSHLTHRWSKADSNSESHPRATPPAATRFVADSALEQAGFEL